MKKITPTDPLAQSADPVTSNVEQLKQLFPEAFTEGKINFDVLKQLLGGEVDEREEKYGLNWHGKRRARQMALTPSTGTLRPAPEESVDWDTTQNLMIEGDNLEVLKLLQKSYAGKIKLIYIDPPYNTGGDFVYPDDFADSIKSYHMLTGQLATDGRKLTSNPESSGRYHTEWLNMIYPRLKCARSLLRQDGVIIISIDDAEYANLKSVCDEVFGAENALATLIFDRNRKNDAKYFSVGHEYMVVYAKDESDLSSRDIIFRGAKAGVDDVKKEFERLRVLHGDKWDLVRSGMLEFYASFSDDDPRKPLARFAKVDERGPYRDDGNINWPGGDGPTYPVLHPVTKRQCKLPVSGWRYPTPERFWEEVRRGRVVFGPDETTVPRVRTNLFENADQVMVSVHYSYAQTAANDFSSLFDGCRVFDNPKPWPDLQRLVAYLTDKQDVVLDFFAGSGSFGHAVMAQNALDGGSRRTILVQLPEPLDPEDKNQKVAAAFCRELGCALTVAEITKERLRRAAKKVRDEFPLFTGDTGFRVLRLDSSSIRTWDPQAAATDLSGSLLRGVEHIKADRDEQDVLYELLLKLGLDLTVPVSAKQIAGYDVHAIGAGSLIVCLGTSIGRKEVETLAEGIVAWHAELKPVGETILVFRDSGFEDDVAKTNLTAILVQRGFDENRIRSL